MSGTQEINFAPEHYHAVNQFRRDVFAPGAPRDISIIELKLWHADAVDHSWRSQFLHDMPDFLAGYFGHRYETLLKSGKSGRRRANTFLRNTIGKNVLPRLKKVTQQWQKDYTHGMPSPFKDQLDSLPTYDRQQIRDLSYDVANYLGEAFNVWTEETAPEQAPDKKETAQRTADAYAYLAQEAIRCGTTPPYWESVKKTGRIKRRHAESGLLRMMAPEWWRIRLKRRRDLQREHMAIAVGQVQRSATAYVSRSTLGEWVEQKKRNREFFKRFDLINSDGDRISMAATVTDYQWYQLPDGDVWLGAAEHALFAGKPVNVPAEFASSAAGGNAMTIPVVQSIRPGVELNGQRLTRVRLHNDELEITWTPRDRATGRALQKSPGQRQIESAYPELASGLHLPKFARVKAPAESVSSGDFADPFRPRYAVDVQLLDADGNPDGSTPLYSAVPLPVPMAGNDSGMFQFPPAGTLVEIGFTGGRPDKPFVRQTMPQGNSLPDIKPGEQLQQQREEVSQRITQGGDWVRKTDQAITESSMSRSIEADDETRTLIARETTVKATDKTTVVGKSTLLAGAIELVTLGDYAQAVQGNRVATISGDCKTSIAGGSTIEVAGDLMEKIGGIRSSIAAAQQQVIAPVVWVGSQQINVMQLMLDTLDVVRQLAQLTAAHTHPDTGQPTNAAAIAQTGSQADTLKTKYRPVIG